MDGLQIMRAFVIDQGLPGSDASDCCDALQNKCLKGRTPGRMMRRIHDQHCVVEEVDSDSQTPYARNWIEGDLQLEGMRPS